MTVASAFDLFSRYIERLARPGPFPLESMLTWVYLLSLMREKGVRGDTFEIGVEHGTTGFLLLESLTDDEKATFVDLRMTEAWEQGFAAHYGHLADRVTFYEQSSVGLDPETLGARHKWVHVDGGRLYEHVASDLPLAASLLDERGVLVIDDFFEIRWPNVAIATIDFLRGHPEVVPLLLVNRKLYCTRAAHAPVMREWIREGQGMLSDLAEVRGWEHVDFDGASIMVWKIGAKQAPAKLYQSRVAGAAAARRTQAAASNAPSRERLRVLRSTSPARSTPRVFDLDRVLRGEAPIEPVPTILFPGEVGRVERLGRVVGPSAEKFLRRADRHRVELPPIGVVTLRGARLDSEGFPRVDDAVATSLTQFDRATVTRRIGRTDQQGAIQEIERAVSTIRPGDHIYGHWLVDILPRLWLLREAHLLERTKVLVRQGLPAYTKSLLAAFGVPERQVVEVEVTSRPVLVRELLVPSNLRYDQIFHSAIRSFAGYAFETVTGLDRSDPRGEAKIYVSRGRWAPASGHPRLLTNAEEVEAVYREQGFDIVHPQELDLKAQANLFRGARCIAGEDGSGLHNSLFAAPGTRVQIIKGSMNHTLIQVALCNSLDQPADIVFGPVADAPRPSRSSPLSIDPRLVTEVAI